METNVNNTSQVTTRSVGVKFGIISAVIGIVFFLIQALSGISPFGGKFDWRAVVGILITAGVIFFAHKTFKDNGDGYMSYGQGVGITFWVTLVSIVINVLFIFVYVKLIDPYLMENFQRLQEEEMASKGMNEQQIEMGLKMMTAIFWPMYIIMGMIFGMIIGLVVGIFTQKKNPQPVF